MPLDPNVINQAMDEGATPDELEAHFTTDLGLSQEESRNAIIDATVPAIQSALSDNQWEDIASYLRSNKGFSDSYISSLGERLNVQEQQTVDQARTPIGGDIPLGELNTEYDLSESIAYARSLGRMSGSFATLIRGGFSSESQATVDRDTVELNTHIVKALRSQGVDVLYDQDKDELYRTASDGAKVPVDSDFIDELEANIGETAGSIGGAIAGFHAGVALPIPPIGPWGLAAKGLAILGTTVAGGFTGAAAGRGVDIVRLRQLTETKEKLDVQKTMQQMFNAGMDDATFSVALAGVFKLGGAAASRAYRFVKRGNVKGAETELRKIIGVDEVMINDAIAAYTKNTVQSVPRVSAEQAIEGITHGVQGGEALVSAAIAHNPRARGKLIENISQRAKDTRNAAKALTSDDTLAGVKASLDNYKGAISDNYNNVESTASVFMDNSNYVMDSGKILDRLETRTSRNLLERKHADIDYADNFSGLLSLRKSVNNLRTPASGKAVDDVIQSIDKEISSAVSKNLPESGKWLATWREANVKNSEMKALEKNVLYKVLTKKGVTPKRAIDAFSSYITAPDETFTQVMSAIPLRNRIEVEGAVLDKMIKNHSVNAGEDVSAIHFPKLAESLSNMEFTTKGGKALKEAIEFSSEWAKNDVNLLGVTGDVSEPTMATRLFNNPAVRLKLGVYSTAFSLARSRLPGKAGRLQAAIRTTADVLENPRNVKRIKDFIDEFDDPVLTDNVKQLASHNAQFGDKNLTTPKTTLFTTGRVSKGDAGKGVYSYTSEKAANKQGGKVKEIDVYPHRIASTEEIRDVLELANDVDITHDIMNSPRIQAELRKNYIGVKQGNTVLMFD